MSGNTKQQYMDSATFMRFVSLMEQQIKTQVGSVKEEVQDLAKSIKDNIGSKGEENGRTDANKEGLASNEDVKGMIDSLKESLPTTEAFSFFSTRIMSGFREHVSAYNDAVADKIIDMTTTMSSIKEQMELLPASVAFDVQRLSEIVGVQLDMCEDELHNNTQILQNMSDGINEHNKIIVEATKEAVAEAVGSLDLAKKGTESQPESNNDVTIQEMLKKMMKVLEESAKKDQRMEMLIEENAKKDQRMEVLIEESAKKDQRMVMLIEESAKKDQQIVMLTEQNSKLIEQNDEKDKESKEQLLDLMEKKLKTFGKQLESTASDLKKICKLHDQDLKDSSSKENEKPASTVRRRTRSQAKLSDIQEDSAVVH